MSVTLDGQNLFEKQIEIEPSSPGRDSIEKKVAGLDGILSIDLGARSRTIKQKGVLRSKSRAELTLRLKAISAFIDGDTHTLLTQTGIQFDNLRMDVFTVSQQRTSGIGVEADYEIAYTQLTTI
jgi:hypothetical protein